MRALILVSLLACGSFAATTTSTACPEGAAPASQDKNNMNLGCGNIKAVDPGTKVIEVEGGMPTAERNLALDRSFVEAIQGNMDRETVEYRNGEHN